MKRRQRRPRFSSLSSFIQKEDKEDKEENLSSVYKPWIRFALLTFFSFFCHFQTFFSMANILNWKLVDLLHIKYDSVIDFLTHTRFSLGNLTRKFYILPNWKLLEEIFHSFAFLLDCFSAIARNFKFLMKLKLFHTPTTTPSRQSRWIQWCYSTMLNWEKSFLLQSRWF